MNRLKYQDLISSTKTKPNQIEEFITGFATSGISPLYDLLLFVEYTITQQSEAHPKLNALICLLSLLKRPTYPTVTILQLIFLDHLKDPARIAASNSQNNIYDYFQKQGVKSSSGNLQSLSYHFTQCCLDFCLMLAYIKPKILYRNKECSSLSKANLSSTELRDQLSEATYNTIFNKYGFLERRKYFVSNLIQFNRSPHNYIDLFMQEMEQYLISNAKTTYFSWFKNLIKEGEVYLSSEAVARLADIFCFHRLFSVKQNALHLICQLIYYGDLQSLLLVNFTEYFSIIVSRILEAQKRKSRLGVFCLYPEIDGQMRQKEAFLHQFLLCVRRLASVFPTLQSYFVNSGQSLVYQLYVKLMEQGIPFPKWEGQEQYQTKIHKNFRKKKELNQLFLEDLDKQKASTTTQFNPLRPNILGMNAFFVRNKENMEKFLQSKNLTSQEWNQLLEFRRHFEEYIERMTDEASQRQVQDLIEDGIELENRIDFIQQLVLKWKQGKISEQHFKDAVDKPPRGSRREVEEKTQTLKESFRNRAQKDELKCTLTQSASMIKDKISVKMNELVQKRSEVPLEVSQLQLFSKPYLAKDLHSKQITEGLLPLLNLHPLRKDKRTRCGIKLLSGQRMEPSDGNNTPKFRSLLADGGKKGIKVLLKTADKYEKYLSYLDDPEEIKYLAFKELIINCWNAQMTINRSAVKRTENKLITTFTCFCSEGISNLTWDLSEEPSVEIESSSKIIDNYTIEITLTGKFIKFGFRLPIINFDKPNKPRKSLPLPFSFHNFLKIGPVQPFQTPFCQRWAIPYKLQKIIIENPKEFQNYFQGLEVRNREASGRVQLKGYECNLWLNNEDGRLVVEVEAGQEIEGSLLGQLLPLASTKLFTEWKGIQIDSVIVNSETSLKQ